MFLVQALDKLHVFLLINLDCIFSLQLFDLLF